MCRFNWPHLLRWRRARGHSARGAQRSDLSGANLLHMINARSSIKTIKKIKLTRLRIASTRFCSNAV